MSAQPMGAAASGGCGEESVDLYEVRLTCPAAVAGTSQIIGRIQLGIRIPGLTAENAGDYLFGDIDDGDGDQSCDETGCSGAPDLGQCDGSDTVDTSSSETFVLKPHLTSFPGDPDVLYLSLKGKPLDGTGPPSLCDSLPEEVLARIGLPALPTQEASVTTDGADAVADDTSGVFDQFDAVGFQDETGTDIPGADWAFATGPQDASVRMLVSREVADPTGEYWLLKLAATGEEVKELTFGVVAEAGTSPSQYQLLGCGTPGAGTMATCAAAPFPWIDATQSKTGAGVLPQTQNVFWITLHGNLDSADPVRTDTDVLLPVPPGVTEERRVSLGVLQVPSATINPDTPPTLYQDPTDAVLVAPTGAPVLKAPGATPHDLADRNLSQQPADNADSDGDGISEDTDNCRYAPNGLAELQSAEGRRRPRAVGQARRPRRRVSVRRQRRDRPDHRGGHPRVPPGPGAQRPGCRPGRDRPLQRVERRDGGGGRTELQHQGPRGPGAGARIRARSRPAPGTSACGP